VSFDLAVSGDADGVCVPFFSDASAFATVYSGGSPLGCKGMAGTFFVGIQEYGADSVQFGKLPNTLVKETGISGLANTANAVRVTIKLTPSGGSTTLVEVLAQIGSATPNGVASQTMTGTLPTGGTLVGMTAATGGLSAEHKVRRIVISGS
jgi:hypothetical protein